MINRREFLTAVAGGFLWVTGADGNRAPLVEKLMKQDSKGKKTKVSLVKTSDRASGVKRAIGLLQINPVEGKDVLLKPNFNNSRPLPRLHPQRYPYPLYIAPERAGR